SLNQSRCNIFFDGGLGTYVIRLVKTNHLCGTVNMIKQRRNATETFGSEQLFVAVFSVCIFENHVSFLRNFPYLMVSHFSLLCLVKIKESLNEKKLKLYEINHRTILNQKYMN